MGPQSILTNIAEMLITIFLGPKRSIETNISKDSGFHNDKSFWPISPRIFECDKPQETIY